MPDRIDLLIRWAQVQYDTLKYVEDRSRTPNKFVSPEEMSQDLGITIIAAKTRLNKYSKKGWVKRIDIDEKRKAYVLILEGLRRAKWLRILVDTAIAEGLIAPIVKKKPTEEETPAEGEKPPEEEWKEEAAQPEQEAKEAVPPETGDEEGGMNILGTT